MPVAKRFWMKVNKRGPKQPHMATRCWVWLPSAGSDGYGTFHTGPPWKRIKAHRASYELSNGQVPSGKQVLHRCDVKICVRPSHLFVGTQLDNMLDMVAKGRHRPGGRAPVTRAL